jgi:hypothetical protein
MVNPNRRSLHHHRSCRPRLNRLVEAARAKATSYQAWAMAARLVTVQALGGGAELVEHLLSSVDAAVVRVEPAAALCS